MVAVVLVVAVVVVVVLVVVVVVVVVAVVVSVVLVGVVVVVVAVDPYGIHMQKCKLDGNFANATHSNLVACLAEMMRHCGQSVRV